jgi:hypothetical protein
VSIVDCLMCASVWFAECLFVFGVFNESGAFSVATLFDASVLSNVCLSFVQSVGCVWCVQ